MQASRTSLNTKLLRIVLGVLSLVAFATLGSVAWLNAAAERARLVDIDAQAKKSISSKARMMVDSHALALRGLVAENAFTDVQQLIDRAVRADEDVIYGVLVSSEDAALAYSSPTTRSLKEGDLESRLKRSIELALPIGSGKMNQGSEREVTRFGQTVLEVSRPVIEDGEVVAVVRYGFCTKPLERALAQARADSRQILKATLLSIGIAVLLSTLVGFWLASHTASRIVRPLTTLTKAAEAIATGEKGVRVTIATNDELEVLAQAFNDMQAANEDAMQKLSEAMEAALEASRLKSEFLANMSHEIRTPMNGVIGVIRLILKMPLDGKLRRYAETVDASASALMTIINDVLDFSKMEAGKYTLQSAPFDPSVVLQEVAELQSGRAHDKGLELVYRRAPDVPQAVTGDPDRYRQILNNLVANAIKFSDQGEVFVDVTVDRKEEDGYVLRTVVQDTGIGIAEEDQRLLFDAFSQVDGSMVRRYGGTGLGLAISKKLALLMSGEIGVTSTKGVGSSFWFTIKVGFSEAPVRPAPVAFPDGRRALVVEASRRWCRVIEEHMIIWGLECDVVHDGLPALDKVRDAEKGKPYDIAVVGAQLRDISIDGFIKELRQIPGAKQLPLIVLTQLGVIATLTEVEHEVAAQIAKPLRVSELYDCIVGAFTGRARSNRSAPRMGGQGRNGKRQRILIVDDNEINRYVASEQVEQAGFLVDIASNGEEAVKQVQAGNYAAILMDCQMPVMDGYTASKVIRAWEGDQRHTPIIALTAHAMAGERDKVLAAGMDDYLSKPLKPQSLERMLQRYVGEFEPVDEFEYSIEAQSESCDLDMQVQRSARLCKLFIDKVPETLDELDQAVADKDAKRVREKAHKLKGSCLAIGAEPMAKLSERLQFEAEGGKLERSGSRAAELREHYARVARLLHRELGAPIGAPRPVSSVS
jgi:signal transduction histidine kinase/DNA-binding response OmpR family regulator